MEQRRYACDSCRRRRVRCDANQPCTRCVRSGIACTYGSVTSRLSATAYARSLEQQVAELQRQLQALIIPAAAPAAIAPSPDTPSSRHVPIDLLVGPENNLVLADGKKVYKSSAGLNVLRTIADMLGSGRTATPPGKALVEALETPVDMPVQGPLDWLGALLPDKESIWLRAVRATDVALICHDCIDLDSFRARLDTVPEQVPERQSFLALVYALLALDELYTPGSERTQGSGLSGLTYFRASRSIVRDERAQMDLDTVTAMILQARYLLSASTISQAHAALSIAIATAMHMGLHIHDACLQDSFTEAELYQRRRVFAVLCMMETYVAFALGMPRILHTADPEQTLGLRGEDLLDEGASLIARDPTTSEAETILNQKLMKIYAKILDRQSENFAETYMAIDWISRIEKELQDWEQYLPELSDKMSADQRVLQGQLSLRLHYTGSHILLYATCLHHLGRERSDRGWNITGYEYGSTCLRAASQSVVLVETLRARGLLKEVHWLNSYILAWATTILAYFVLHSPTRVTIAESKGAALRANDMLAKLGVTSAAARGIHECLAPYMEAVASATEE